MINMPSHTGITQVNFCHHHNHLRLTWLGPVLLTTKLWDSLREIELKLNPFIVVGQRRPGLNSQQM